MNASAKGRRKEHKIRDVFRQRGYYVIRSAGSLGYFDLIAIPTNKIENIVTIAIQSKPRPYTKAEKRKLYEAWILMPNIKIEGWVVPDNKTPYMEFCLDNYIIDNT